MRKLTLLAMVLSVVCLAKAQDGLRADITEFQARLNEQFKNPSRSPLDVDSFKEFTGLSFFPIHAKYRVTAFLERTPETPIVQLGTNTIRKPLYHSYGIAHFELEGKACALRIFQKHSSENQAEVLFLPFGDLTNGIETYAGGRYLDLDIPKGDSIVIDFNKAYHPFCAYNHRYSCVLVPKENRLNCKILAGVMLEDGWAMMHLKDLRFEVRFPEQPTVFRDTSQGAKQADIQRFRYVSDFAEYRNFLFEVEVRHYRGSTCPQIAGEEYNSCFSDILTEKLEETGGRLVQVRHSYEDGFDTFDFEISAQGKAFSRYRVILVRNLAYIANVLTMNETANNRNLVKFFDSFRIL